jgi:PPE-repeat protein
MDFAMLSPEINSGLMYAGPGSGPMLAAAEVWDGLAAELHSAANSYQAVISGLTAGPWLGPSSASMAAAAASYATWLSATAAQAEETATRAKAAAAAYEVAFASTVPPPVIAANRSLLAVLVAKNLFGQNAAAIAATEARYAEMWALDTAAMYGYAGSSASATALTPFTPPRQNTNPGGAAGQAAAVGQAAGTSAGNVQSTVSSVPQAFSAVPDTLQSLATAAPAATADPSGALSTLGSLASLLELPIDGAAAALSVITPGDFPFSVLGYTVSAHTDDIVSGWAGVEPYPGTEPAPPTPFPVITDLGPTAASASAGLGEANTVGALSVPPTWTIATPAVRPIALVLPALPATSVSATGGEALRGASGSTFSDMALAGMAGRAMAGTLGTGGGRDGGKAATGKRVAARAGGAATTDDPAAAHGEGEASQSKPRTVVTGVAAELREFAKLRDEGILTDEEFTEQKDRLLGR